jgi:hypothetical protein
MRLALMLLPGLLLVDTARAQEPPAAWPSSFVQAVAAQGTLGRADTLFAVPLLGGANVIRATVTRCFDCEDAHLALLSRGHDSLLIAGPSDLTRAWMWISAAQSAGSSLRARLTALVTLTCVPGCNPRLLTSADSINADSRLFLGPRDSLTAIQPPAEREAGGEASTVFFLSTTTGIYRLSAVANSAGVLDLKVAFIAGYSV